MKFFDFFRLSGGRRSADTAKERLQLLLAHERAHRNGPDFLPMLQKELVAVICKYVEIDIDRVEVKLESNGDISMLEVNIELPPGRTESVSCAPAR
jgi:cell division topological specificity factor